LKIRTLRLKQFKKFDQPVEVDGFDDGLNLIAGPNETGKSTLLLALRAALFEAHSSSAQAVKDFAPHHVTGARPEISLDFDIGGKTYHLEKRFLKGSKAKLEAPGGKRFEGQAAETELKRLLGLSPSEKTSTKQDSPAHFGVLLTPQTRSFQQPDLADGTRHSLEAAIAADIAELGNQSEVDGLLAELQAERANLVDGHGKKRGRYKEVDRRLEDIEREIAAAIEERDQLRDQLERLGQAIAERSALQTAESSENASERLSWLESKRTQAIHRQILENSRLTASQRLQALETNKAAYRGRLEEKQRLVTETEAIDKTAEGAGERQAAIEASLSKNQERDAHFAEQQRLLSQKRRDLEALGRQFERRVQIEATLSALATDVRLQLDDGALDRVTLDGEPAPFANDLRQVTEGLLIEIDGIGRIGIEPKIEPMREALSAKAEVENEIGNLRKRLNLEDTDPEAIEAVWQTVAEEITSLEASSTEIAAALLKERREAAEAKALLDASHDRRTRLAKRLAEIETTHDDNSSDQAALDAEIMDAKTTLNAADEALRALPSGENPEAKPAPPDQLDVEIKSLRTEIEKRRRAIDDAHKTVVALEAAIGVRAGLGLDERIDQLERQRHLLASERDAYTRDHDTITLLQTTLRTAADEAKATFNVPLAKRLAPYVQKLLPEATPLVTPDFSIRALDRGGIEEPFLQLSDGTREQIAVLARISFADMLKSQGFPALLILDDALAFSDDHRLERMFEILEEAAKHMQVIILTCREDRFAKVEATRLQITPAPEQTSSAA